VWFVFFFHCKNKSVASDKHIYLQHILLRSVHIVETDISIYGLCDLVIYPLRVWCRFFRVEDNCKAFSATYGSRLIDSTRDLHQNVFSIPHIHNGLLLEVGKGKSSRKICYECSLF
jgi:hypothetical protein